MHGKRGDMYIPVWLIVIIAILFLFYLRWGKKKEDFRPYRIIIDPNWDKLLADFKLIDANLPPGEWWHQILEKHPEIQSDINCAFNSGLSFTVLTPSLAYDNNRHTFHSRIDFRAEMKGITIPDPNEGNLELTPELCIEPGVTGFDLGITMHWARIGKKVPTIIATIPISAFNAQSISEEMKGWIVHDDYLEHKYFNVWHEYI